MLDGLNAADALRVADKSDRARLQRFTCTEPSTAKYKGGRTRGHPFPWELDVQSWFRSRSTPLRSEREQLIVIDRGGEITAASHYAFMEDASAWIIRALARSVNVNGQGHGRIILRATLELCMRSAPDLPVVTKIEERNERSQALFSAHGFILTGDRVQQEPTMQWWAREAEEL